MVETFCLSESWSQNLNMNELALASLEDLKEQNITVI